MTAKENSNVESIQISVQRRKPGEYCHRNSLLTDLFRISHLKCVRNAIFSAIVLTLSRQMVEDYFRHGSINWTFDLLRQTVGALDRVFLIWTIMTLSTIFLVFAGVFIWITHRNSTRINLRIHDRISVFAYLLYFACFLVIPCYLVVAYQLPLVSSSIILAEQLRQLMKTHSFVREKTRQVFQSASKKDDRSLDRHDFYHYVYYLFAPTLIYRSHYPRTTTIRWNVATNMFSQFLFALIATYQIIAYFWMPIFQRILADNERTVRSMIIYLYDLMVPGVLIVILSFYGFFHCWLNTFAELLRFGDRMFYEDWWNMTSAATFWRSWNAVVHDWLYLYIYKDFHRWFPTSRNLSTMMVVIVSAIFHEYFIIVVLQLKSPVIIIWFLLFGILFRFSFPEARGTGWNIFLLTFVPITSSLIPYLYVLEIAKSNSTQPMGSVEELTSDL